MNDYYLKKKEPILEEFGTSIECLSSEKAQEVLAEKGPNMLQEGKKKSTLQVFLSQFKDLLVVILIIAAIISMI